MIDENLKVETMLNVLRASHPKGNLNGIYKIYSNKFLKFFGLNYGYLEVYMTSETEVTLFVRSGLDTHNKIVSGIDAAFVDIDINEFKFTQFYKVALSAWLEREPHKQELLRERFYDLVVNRDLKYVKYSDLSKA